MATVGPARQRPWPSSEGLLHRVRPGGLSYSGIRIISLAPHLLLDTHVLVRWLLEPKRLSRDQARVLCDANRRGEPLAFSAITLLEIAVLFGRNRTGLRVPIRELF
jgi:hypothetical protein